MRTIVNISIICFLKVFLNLAIILQKQNFVGRTGIFQTTYFNFSKDVLFLQLAAGEEMSFPLLFVPALSPLELSTGLREISQCPEKAVTSHLE